MSKSSVPMPTQVQHILLSRLLTSMFGSSSGTLITLIWLWGLVTAMGLSAAAVWQFLVDFLGPNNITFPLHYVVGFVAFPILLYFSWRKVSKEARRGLPGITAGEMTPHRGLIFTLSDLDKNRMARTVAAMSEAEGGDMAAFFKADGRHPWEHACRIVAAHGNTLEWLGVVLTPESQQQFQLFTEVLKKVVPTTRHLEIVQEVVPSAFAAEKLAEAIQILLGWARKRLAQGEVVIDATGGTKPASIAAIMAALSWPEALPIQYVETTADETGKHKVLSLAYRAGED